MRLSSSTAGCTSTAAVWTGIELRQSLQGYISSWWIGAVGLCTFVGTASRSSSSRTKPVRPFLWQL